MNSASRAPGAPPSPPHPLRLWPGVLIVALQWLARFLVPVLAPAALPYGVLAGLAGSVAVIVWWGFSAARAGAIASVSSS